MKKVFVYGILQQDILAGDFGIKPEYVIGKADLKDYKRIDLSYIVKNKGSKVRGELIEIPDDLEENLNRFESQFGYNRSLVDVYIDNKKLNIIEKLGKKFGTLAMTRNDFMNLIPEKIKTKTTTSALKGKTFEDMDFEFIK